MALATAEMKRKGAQAGVGIGRVRNSTPVVPEQAMQSRSVTSTVKESMHR